MPRKSREKEGAGGDATRREKEKMLIGANAGRIKLTKGRRDDRRLNSIGVRASRSTHKTSVGRLLTNTRYVPGHATNFEFSYVDGEEKMETRNPT